MEPSNIAQGFSNLSSTIRSVGKAIKSFDEMESVERKAHDEHQAALDSVFGTVGKGLSREGYDKLVQTQNALAQKEGVIKAYENFTFMDSVEEERANIRLNAFKSEMKKYIPAMSNPTAPLDYDSAESAAFDILNMGTGVIGVDSTGNDVTMDFEGMSSGEIVTMSRGFSQNRVVMDAAVSDLREKETIKSSEARFQSTFVDYLTWAEETGTRGLMSPQFKALSDKYYGLGVENMNGLILNTIEAHAVDTMTQEGASIEELLKVYDMLDMFEKDIEIRDGAGTFAAVGTDNYLKVEGIRHRAEVQYAANQREAKETAKGVIEKSENKILDIALGRVLDGTPMTESRKSSIKRELAITARNEGIYDIDKLLGQIDTFISSQDYDDSGTRASFLDSATKLRYERTELERLNTEALIQVRAGTMTTTSYGLVTTKTNGYIKDMENGNVATFADAKKRLSTNSSSYETVMKNTLLSNDKKFSQFDVAKQFSTVTTKFTEDNTPDVKHLADIRRYEEQLDSLAIYGGKLKRSKTLTRSTYKKDGQGNDILDKNGNKIVASEGEYEFLVRSGIPEFQIDSVLETYNEAISFATATVEGSQDEISRATTIDAKVSNYAVMKAFEQMIEYKEFIASVQGTLNFGTQTATNQTSTDKTEGF